MFLLIVFNLVSIDLSGFGVTSAVEPAFSTIVFRLNRNSRRLAGNGI